MDELVVAGFDNFAVFHDVDFVYRKMFDDFENMGDDDERILAMV